MRPRTPCTCADERWCHPIGPPTAAKLEVFGFAYPYTKNFRQYDFRQLTTVAWNEDPELVCLAHSHGARVVLSSGPLDAPFSNATARAAWVEDQVRRVVEARADGVNFDFEGPVASAGADLSRAYTATVRDLGRALREAVPGAQVSVDVPWWPYDIDGRNYDWQGLTEAADIVFVMVYDTLSQIWGSCAAGANSPALLADRSLRGWLALGVPADKLVLGLPWYGYDYECQPDPPASPGPAPDARLCLLRPVPFQGAPCSDAAGAQLNFRDAMQILRDGRNTTPLAWDGPQQSPWFNYRAGDGSLHQVWFDTPESLTAKYLTAAKYGIRGVGMWNTEALDYSEAASPEAVREREAMWDALAAFTGRGRPEPGPSADEAVCAKRVWYWW